MRGCDVCSSIAVAMAVSTFTRRVEHCTVSLFLFFSFFFQMQVLQAHATAGRLSVCRFVPFVVAATATSLPLQPLLPLVLCGHHWLRCHILLHCMATAVCVSLPCAMTPVSPHDWPMLVCQHVSCARVSVAPSAQLAHNCVPACPRTHVHPDSAACLRVAGSISCRLRGCWTSWMPRQSPSSVWRCVSQGWVWPGSRRPQCPYIV
jgi:hypothetical protein